MGNDTAPGAWLTRAARRWPKSSALVHRSHTFSFDELNHRVGALANGYSQAVTGPLAVVSNQAIRIAWATWLALHLGKPLLPLDPRRPAQLGLLGDLGIGLAFADDGTLIPSSANRLDSQVLEQTPFTGHIAGSPAPPDAVQVLRD